MEVIVSTIAVIIAASCLVAFVRTDLKEQAREQVHKPERKEAE